MEFDDFLREAAPLLGLQWQPFRRKGVKRKVERRLTQMGLSNFEEYLPKVKKDSEEQCFLSKIFTVTISRFFRDKKVFDTLRQYVFPNLLKEDRKELKIWSIGCASGEEPYSLSLLWKEAFERSHPHIVLSLLATDIDEKMLERAKGGKYKKSSLKEVPEEILRKFFNREGEFYLLDEIIRESTEFRRHDILREEPFRGMDIISCRNLAFTYFSEERRMEILKKIASSLKEKGYLVIGKDEFLPLTYPTLFVPSDPEGKIYERFPSGFCRRL
jgi:chemotaxis methyl-accepting protein methylase